MYKNYLTFFYCAIYLSTDCKNQIVFQNNNIAFLNSTYILPNNNWDQKDTLSKIQLGYGNMQSNPIITGATYRGNSDMGGSQGSCQFWQKNTLNYIDSGWNPYLVGVGAFFFDSSKACGQCLLILNPKTKKYIVSVITDYCPPPCSSRQLDIQVAGSAFLASGNSFNSVPYKGGPENYSNLQVWKVECDWKNHLLEYYFDTGSSRFHFYLILLYASVPPTRVEIYKVDNSFLGKSIIAINTKITHDTYGRWVISFPDGNAYKSTYAIKLYYDSNLQTQKSKTSFILDYFYWNGEQHSLTSGKKYIPLSDISHNIKNWPM